MKKLILTTAIFMLSSQAFAVTCLEVSQAERKLEILEKNIEFRKSLPPGPNDHLLSPQDKFRLEISRIKSEERTEKMRQDLKDIIEHKPTCTQ